jgi:fluoroquinolone transport system permease protein
LRIATFFAVQTGPLLLGAVSGLMLLDERDESSLTSLRGTPLRIGRYALYRASGPVLLSIALCFGGVYFVGLVAAPPLRIAAVAAVNALGAPIISLALVSLAGDKVEGMALMKGMGIFMFAPVIGWFVDPPMRWLLGVIPTLWPAEARGSFWPVIAVGLVSHLLLLWLLLRRFHRRL